MNDEPFGLRYWLTHAAASGPVLVMLVVGIVVCYRQRQRRPRVARLLGGAMLAELVWLTLGFPALFAAFQRLGLWSGFQAAEAGEFGWVVRSILMSLPYATVNAAIWGTALWAVLNVEDWQTNSPEMAAETGDESSGSAGHFDGDTP